MMENNFSAIENVLTYICNIISFFFCNAARTCLYIDTVQCTQQSSVPGYLSFESMVFGIFFFYGGDTAFSPFLFFGLLFLVVAAAAVAACIFLLTSAH